MKHPLLVVAALVAIAAGIAWYAWQANAPAPEAPAVPPPVATAPTEAPPVAPLPPPIQHPLPPPEAAAPPLPPLADSDTLARDTIVGLVGRDAFARYFVPDALVRNFVVTVDNLPRKTAAVRMWPVRPVPGAFVTTTGAQPTIAPDNALRYRPYIVAMEAAEAKHLVAAYVRLYPLFQKAYEELGYPNAYFNDRLIQAIDDMLAAPDVAAPALVQPKVLYQFADPALEERSAGQKILLRMGSANAARVKDKLRAIRKEVVAQAPQS
ncbi:MAG: DUF3014 domain-containing protein [Burkholderiales bacterium]|nr:DUF3014 domain-containing protein [Burkholderiales bacterium]